MTTGIESARQSWWRRPFTHFAALTVGGLLLVALGAMWASGRAAHDEALSEARSITESSLRTVVLPGLTTAVLDGDPEAIDRFDRAVRDHLLDDSIVRVKLWRQDGTIVYSDAAGLIGETHEIEDHRLNAVAQAVSVADRGDLDDRENRFEQDLGPLLEVYQPFQGPGEETMLFEVYFTDASVARSESRIRSTVLPIVVLSLTSLGLMTLGLAYHLQRRIDRSARERELLLRRAVDASAIERRRIAADLHDGAVQELSGTLMLMAAAQRHNAETSEAGTRLKQATVALRQSLRSLRAVALDIHPSNLADVGLRAALADLVETFADRNGLTINLSFQTAATSHDRLLYRFVREGLRNVVKHANANAVEVTIQDRAGTIVASVTDDGSGSTTNDGHGGMGLRLLRELAAEVDGTATFQPNPSLGSTLTMEIPR